MFGRCEQSGYNLATIQPTIQIIYMWLNGVTSIGKSIVSVCFLDGKPSCIVLPYTSTAPWKYFEGVLAKGLERNVNYSHIIHQHFLEKTGFKN
jgi:hypothetical protein